MAAKKQPNPGVFLHVFAPCPCCSKKMAVTFRSMGYAALVDAEHWNQERGQDN